VADAAPLHEQEREDSATSDREWRVQQVGRLVLAGVLLAALAGVFGPGPLSWSSVTGDDDRLVVHYSRFARAGGPVALGLQVAPEAVQDGQVQLWVSNELLESLEVRQITPEPDSQTVVGGGPGEGVVLVFSVEPGAGLDARIDATADAIGFREGAVGLVGDEALSFGQLYYP
jgi:hypothetical protein